MHNLLKKTWPAKKLKVFSFQWSIEKLFPQDPTHASVLFLTCPLLVVAVNWVNYGHSLVYSFWSDQTDHVVMYCSPGGRLPLPKSPLTSRSLREVSGACHKSPDHIKSLVYGLHQVSEGKFMASLMVEIDCSNEIYQLKPKAAPRISVRL